MVSGLIGRMLRKAASATGSAGNFAFLDAVERGLGAKTEKYLVNGTNRDVLATLSAKQPAVAKAWQDNTRNGIAGHKRRRAIAEIVTRSPGYPDLIARTAEIAALTIFPRTQTMYVGTDDTMHEVRVLGVLINNDRSYASDTAARSSIDDIREAVRLIGGTDVDLLDIMFGGRYGSIVSAFQNKNAARDGALDVTVDDLREAFIRLDAAGRDNILQAYKTSNVKPKGDFLPFLFSLAADGSAKVRDAARALIVDQPPADVEDMAIADLGAGKAAVRTTMVQILGEIGSDRAFAALKDRIGVEKTQSVKSLIEQFLSTEDTTGDLEVDGGYLDVTGATVALPDVPTITPDDNSKPFGAEDRAILDKLDAEDFAQRKANEAERKAKGYPTIAVRKQDRAKALIDFFHGKLDADDQITRGPLYGLRNYWPWIRSALNRIPEERALRLAIAANQHVTQLFTSYTEPPLRQWLQDALENGRLDLRAVLAEAEALKIQFGSNYYYMRDVDYENGTYEERLIRHEIEGDRWYKISDNIPEEAIWPVIANNLGMLAQYLPPHNLSARENANALDLLATLPSLPKAFVNPILYTAIGEARGPRDKARELLEGIDGLDDTIIAALEDSRQAIRANVADFLASRGTTTAIPALHKRLKKEKSELARAALISAIEQLGGDTDAYLGKKALEKEAKTLSAKLKADKYAWLETDHAPKLRWKDGKPCPPDICDAWMKLACKLKQPGDPGLFRLYLDQINPDDAAALGDWIFGSWVAHDSYLPPREEIVREAVESVKANWSYYSNSKYYKDKTPEEIAAINLSYMPVSYPNSGSDAKGLLALTVYATPQKQAQTAAHYLKNHGRRVAQAKSVIDMLAGAASPEATQVIVSSATRFKQRTVREHAQEVVERLAEAKGWTPDELADRSIPTGGLEEGSRLVLTVGEDHKPYTVQLAEDLTLKISNPDGKDVKSLPAGKDDVTKEAKAALSDAKKTVKTVVTQQSARFYEAMMASRTWRIEDWQSDLNDHPIMAHLTKRVVWRGLDDTGAVRAVFRPTPEGDRITADGDDADLTGVTAIDIAHGSQFSDDERQAWLQHLEDFEVKPFFNQLTRPILRLTDDQKSEKVIDDRKGWLMESLRLRSAATRLGFNKGPAEDGGWYFSFNKSFASAGIFVELGFTGAGQESENHPVALTDLQFFDLGRGGRGRQRKLGDVPALLLSETWNDYRELADLGAFDPDWEKKAGY